MCLFTNIFEEYLLTKKQWEKRSSQKVKSSLEKFVHVKNSNLNIEKQTDLFLENKLNILEDLIVNLKQKFIFKKITDISINIRSMISDYITKISKNNLTEFFDDESIKFFPFFLLDPSDKIKLKYLQIIYERLDNMNEKDFDCVIKILKESRDSILNICIKEEKTIAKRAIKIIDLLSKNDILDLKTVNLLLPHLFNPDPQIRNLISNVTINYILDYEKNNDIIAEEENEESIDEENVENSEENKNKAKSSEMDICEEEPNSSKNINIINNNFTSGKKKDNKSKKAAYKYTLDNLCELLKFFNKLTEKDDKMIKVLVDNFYSKMSVFKNFTLFFDLFEAVLNQVDVVKSKTENNSHEITENNNPFHFPPFLIKIGLNVLKFSIDKMQEEIDLARQSSNVNELIEEQIPLNEEFLNNLILRTPSIIRKIILNDDLFYENFVDLTNLFENFKLYSLNLIKFQNDQILEILEQMKKVFFHSFIMKNEAGEYFSYNNFISRVIENIGKTTVKLTNFLRINKLNEENINITDHSIIKEICTKFFEKISSVIYTNKIYQNDEILEEEINIENAEYYLYLIVRFDCILNYFGSSLDNFMNNFNHIKFQTLIFNLIYFYRKKISSNTMQRIQIFKEINQLKIRKGQIKLKDDENNNNDGTESQALESAKNKKAQKDKKLENKIEKLETELENSKYQFHNLEYFLQNFMYFGIKVLKSINILLLTKVVYSINSDSIGVNGHVTQSDFFTQNKSLSQNKILNNNNLIGVNASLLSHYVEIYLKYVNNLFNNFEKILDYEFNFTYVLDKSEPFGIYNMDHESNTELKEVFSQLIQDRNVLNFEIKSNFICLILELMIYISSEKLDLYCTNNDYNIKFKINDFLLAKIEKFMKKEFVFYFILTNKKIKEIKQKINVLQEMQEENELNEKDQEKLELLCQFKANIENLTSMKCIFLKNICESYSKLLIQNLGVFKNRSLVMLFFESFYLINSQNIIDSINAIVYQNLLEKEISFYLKDEENNKLNWMIFYFSKIAVKVFSKNCSLFKFEEFVNSNKNETDNKMDIIDDRHSSNNTNGFNFYEFFNFYYFEIIEKFNNNTHNDDNSSNVNESLMEKKPDNEISHVENEYQTFIKTFNENKDEKISMLKKYFDVYLKSIRKIKASYNKETAKSIDNKDKIFIQEFICNSINYALSSKLKNEIVTNNTLDNKIENFNEMINGNPAKDLSNEMNNLNKEKIEYEIIIENIKFLELVKYILRNCVFITEKEYQTLLMLFVKLSKNIETTENVNRADIRIIESTKNFLISKAKLFSNTEDKKDGEKSDNENEEGMKNKKTKKKNHEKESKEDNQSGNQEEEKEDVNERMDKEKNNKGGNKKKNKRKINKSDNESEEGYEKADESQQHDENIDKDNVYSDKEISNNELSDDEDISNKNKRGKNDAKAKKNKKPANKKNKKERKHDEEMRIGKKRKYGDVII